jgi:hemoglobin
VRAISEAFYDAMSELEPALARLHPCDPDGRVAREPRDKFALFFIGWLGGPQDYVAQHGHPRLRMRHAKVPVDTTMAQAWMRCMRRAFDVCGVDGDVRAYLDARLEDVALFLRNAGA